MAAVEGSGLTEQLLAVKLTGDTVDEAGPAQREAAVSLLQWAAQADTHRSRAAESSLAEAHEKAHRQHVKIREVRDEGGHGRAV